LTAGYDFDCRSQLKIDFKGGGQGCPPHTICVAPKNRADRSQPL
jgi:hypothetical protein